MRKGGSPLPEVGWAERLALNVMPPIQATVSGEITSTTVLNLGATRFKGAIKNVWLSVGQCGRDDSGNSLSLAADVRINGTTALATPPAIAAVTGEAAVQKTTAITSDTGITAAVLDYTNYTFDAGDTIEATLVLTRTASPDSEMANPCVVVELEPT
jgi:hypothetical protein